MKKRAKYSNLIGILLPAICVVVLLCFLSGISNVSRSQEGEEKRRLEDAIRRNTVACYAAEGIYPPNLTYLEEHYGVQINRNRYDVIYQLIGENLMPDITVVDK